MNILFFLTPKSDVAYVEEDDSLRQVLEKMEHQGKIYRNHYGRRCALEAEKGRLSRAS